MRFWIFINRFGFGSICRINRRFGFGFTLLGRQKSMNDVLNGVTPLTYTKKLRRRNVRINARKHAVMFTNKLFYNFFLFFDVNKV